MTRKVNAGPVNMDLALLDPGSVFPSPETVFEHDELTAAQKAEILRRWEYNVREEAVALEEGMPGERDGDQLRRIQLALDKLGGRIDVEHAGPTKQHGLPSASGRQS